MLAAALKCGAALLRAAWDLTFVLAGECRWPRLSSGDEEEEEAEQHRHRGIGPVALPGRHITFSESCVYGFILHQSKKMALLGKEMETSDW